MRINRFLCTAVIFFTVVLTACNSIKNKQWNEDFIEDESYSDFISKADDYLIKKSFNGSVLIGKGKKIIFAKGYGPSDKNDSSAGSNSIHTVYEIGSITKQITGAAIMQLEREGKLSEDNKISKYFPFYSHGEEITVGMLLKMRSGLYDHINMAYEFFPAEIAAELDREAVARNNGFADSDFVLKYLNDSPVMTDPDSTHFYCNTDYYLLGKIIEIVSGMTYEEYIRKNIFNKCGMWNSNANYEETTAKGYDYKGRYFSILGGLGLGCGDINSTVLDLFKWNYCLAHGKVITKKDFKKIINNDSYNYGFYHGENSLLHGGATNVFNSFIQYFLDDEISIIVLANQPMSECSATIVGGNLKDLFFEYN